MPTPARRLVLALLGVVVGTVGLVTPRPAAPLTCMALALIHPMAPLGPSEVVAHLRVLRSYPKALPPGLIDVQILRVFHGRERRSVVTVDAGQVLAWRMTPPWSLEGFPDGSEWVMVLRPATTPPRARYQPVLCRAFLRVSGGLARGYVTADVAQEISLEELAHRIETGPR
jgi:hypothetical protein